MIYEFHEGPMEWEAVSMTILDNTEVHKSILHHLIKV